jgi:hypothetical protein
MSFFTGHRCISLSLEPTHKGEGAKREEMVKEKNWKSLDDSLIAFISTKGKIL